MTLIDATVDVAPARPESASLRSVRMVGHQVRYDLLSLVRNRAAQGFTLAMPISFLVLFVAIFGHGTFHVDGVGIAGSTYYVAALTAFAVVNVGFMSLVIMLVELRENGILRRRRATPQPAWTIIGGRAVSAVLTTLATCILLLAVGRVAYGASIPLGALPAVAVAVVLSVLVMVCLAFGVAGLIKSFQAAQPVVMALALPLTFISGVFVPWQVVPHWLQQVSAVFPVRAAAVTLLDPYLAHAGRSAWDPSAMLVLAAWGAGGLLLAVRRFRWAPRDV